jgi:release factor glutamine methyltransferase
MIGLHAALDILRSAGVSRSDSLDIVSYGSGVPYRDVLTAPDKATVSEIFMDSVLEKLSGNLPVAYITGRREFYSLELNITRDTLIPRPETEILVEAVLQSVPRDKPLNIIDLCTGSGAILLSLLANLPGSKGTGVDISSAALSVAKLNARKLSLEDRCSFIQADITKGFPAEGFDLLTANPPYVSAEDYGQAPASLHHEPYRALVPEGPVFAFYKLMLSGLKKSGSIASAYLETGYKDADTIAEFGRAEGFSAEIIKDLAGCGRVVKLMRRKTGA